MKSEVQESERNQNNTCSTIIRVYGELYTEYINENRNVITVYYCCKDNINWVFETDIPHETFLTYDGGYNEEYSDFDDGFARCMVFELSALKIRPT